MYEVKRYHCDFCKKVLANKYAMKKHEEKCWYNPKLKACFTCLKFCESRDGLEPYCSHHEVNIFRKSSVEPSNPKNLLFYTGNCKHWVDGTPPEDEQ